MISIGVKAVILTPIPIFSETGESRWIVAANIWGAIPARGVALVYAILVACFIIHTFKSGATGLLMTSVT